MLYEAPGIFGFDYSEHCAPCGEEIPMGDFDQLPSNQETPVHISERGRPAPSLIPEESGSPIRPEHRKGYVDLTLQRRSCIISTHKFRPSILHDHLLLSQSSKCPIATRKTRK